MGFPDGKGRRTKGGMEGKGKERKGQIVALVGYHQEEEAPAIWPHTKDARVSASQDIDAGDG